MYVYIMYMYILKPSFVVLNFVYLLIITVSPSPSSLQEIVPQSASSAVLDLFVPRNELEERKREAEALPKLNIDKLDCQWLQVHVHYLRNFSLKHTCTLYVCMT